jgi:hypothetical protein
MRLHRCKCDTYERVSVLVHDRCAARHNCEICSTPGAFAGITLTVCHLDQAQHPLVASWAQPAPCLASQLSLPVLAPCFHLRLIVLRGDMLHVACRDDDFKARGLIDRPCTEVHFKSLFPPPGQRTESVQG